MKKYIIYWNIGYGKTHKIVEAENGDDAQQFACESWREEVEDNGDYGHEPWTQDREDDLF